MAEHFLFRSSLQAEDCLSVAGQPVLERHAALHELLTARLGAEAAELFAEPFVSRGAAGAALNVAWHSVHAGEARPLADLDPALRRAVEDRLLRLLPKIEALATDPGLTPDLAALVRAALSLSQAADVRAINGVPVLVNWGVRPRGGAPALAGFMRGDAAAAGPAAAAPGPATVPPPIPDAAQPGPAMSAGLPPAATRPVLPLAAWLPLPILLVLLCLVLIWLLLPGTRVFPPQSVVRDADVSAAQETELGALRDRRDALRQALAGAQCREDGVLVLPGNRTPEGLSLPAPGAAPEQGQVAPDSPVAPAPERALLPAAPGAPAETDTLLARIEAATVLVIAPGAQGVSTGSGFAVGPGLIVTNQHVIEDLGPEGAFVVNKLLGQPQPAQVLKTAGPLEAVGADFALLKIGSTALPALPLADPAASLKLNHVVAAGFPGDVMETDAAYEALLRGDGAAMPGLVVVDGTVNAEQPLQGATETLLHSAPLAQGNSGGPLVDFCGRVLGVNTFVRQGPLRTLNFALSAAGLAEFLAGTPAAVTPDRASCQPMVAPASATPAPTPAPAPAPAAPAPGAPAGAPDGTVPATPGPGGE
ncbi:trypsin-like peptidase domain-containing protein [Rhodobacter capsulatus]|uniref:trypsin-like peptidase domain-containing protein n=1 Tax=Rhodobacter capsulatus TaxID=1061 RepID=UPI0003D3A143|nr:trypsin-like peptidase domain-containing protein [Rhodobacter capsulatus]ETD02716.1 serine protease [Rhodobacter capsulatus DE442]ETD78873.1 serine protease [Rhodobacter capsulatus R121]ETE54852.1 serine protease [Rhodobacter capsulatus Y262]